MVKVNAPAMSLDASGSLAGALVFSKWKGRNYVRQLVRPANPKLPKQVSVRAMFKFLSQVWKLSVKPSYEGSWEDLAKASVISPFNAYMQKNIRRWREFNAPSMEYPATEDGTEPVAVLTSATGAVRHIDVLFTITTLNDVWGVMLFRSPTGTFTPSFANCIAVLEVDDTGELVYTDSNLAAGEYFYDARFFTKAGLLGDEEGEVSGTAT
ncbi:MAG TPA: hypothetical protein VMY42_12115 [Thermoguttaceae bacterium]|nr:hypothetical protein [Thermoguttaceae bacterium]